MPYYNTEILLKDGTIIKKEIIASNVEMAKFAVYHDNLINDPTDIKKINVHKSEKFFHETIDDYNNDIYLIELKSSSGIQLIAKIYKKDTLGYIKDARQIIPYLIKNQITDILEQDDNYNQLNMLEKAEKKKEIMSKLEQKFLENNYENLIVDFHTSSTTTASHHQIKVTLLKNINN